MFSRLNWLLAIVIVVTLVPSSARAEGGWIPNLNPFAKKSGPPTGGGGGWKMPKLWPSSAPAAPFQPAPPSTWQKMKTGTRNAWNKTTDMLNPFDDANDAVQQPNITGSNSAFRQATMSPQKTEKSGSWLPTMPWSSKAKEPQTVNSFLARERPGFNN